MLSCHAWLQVQFALKKPAKELPLSRGQDEGFSGFKTGKPVMDIVYNSSALIKVKFTKSGSIRLIIRVNILLPLVAVQIIE